MRFFRQKGTTRGTPCSRSYAQLLSCVSFQESFSGEKTTSFEPNHDEDMPASYPRSKRRSAPGANKSHTFLDVMALSCVCIYHVTVTFRLLPMKHMNLKTSVFLHLLHVVLCSHISLHQWQSILFDRAHRPLLLGFSAKPLNIFQNQCVTQKCGEGVER